MPPSRRWPVALAPALAAQLYLALSHRYAGDDAGASPSSRDLARDAGLRPLATNDVHYHHPDRRPLQDVVTCIREHVRIAEAGPLLFANAERHLKPPDEMARLFRDRPRGAREHARDRRALPLLARRARLRLPGPDSYDGRTPDEELAGAPGRARRWRYPGPSAGEGRTS